MTDEKTPPNKTLKELGIRHVEGYFNLNSGRLEELLIEVIDRRIEGKWWTVNYSVDLGTAVVDKLPEMQDPVNLAELMMRCDVAVRKVEGIEEVRPWHDYYSEHYVSTDLEEIEGDLPTYVDEFEIEDLDEDIEGSDI